MNSRQFNKKGYIPVRVENNPKKPNYVCKVVEINKQPCNQAHKYSMTNIEAEEEASKKLDAGAFKLWRYFSRNQHGYTFALSSSVVEKNSGIKKKQYRDLIEKDYLVLKQGNIYIFYEALVVSKGNKK